MSGSGTDYKRAILAVPEPATWVLMLMGVLVLGQRALRRQAA